MKRISNKALITALALGISFSAFAGNKDRVGQSGAPELLMNPWARSTGVFGMNVSYVGGIEAMKCNIAGLAQDSTLEVGLSHGAYLSGAGIDINNLAVGVPIGSVGVLGINIMSIGFGDITATDYYNPEGYGTFRPQFLNVELGYARQFTTHINGGFSMTYVSEQMNNISALGLSFNGGVQYVTGKRDNFHLGMTLCNLGTNMRFNGPGFAVNTDQQQATPTYVITGRVPSDKFELPTYLGMGMSYDFYLDEHHLKAKDSMPMHKLTILGNFTSNSFINDYLGVGAEYSYRNMFQVRAAYRYEKGITDAATSLTMFVGLSAGATVQTQIGANGPHLAIDYSYRPTQRPANGVHMFSLRFTRGTPAVSKDSDE